MPEEESEMAQEDGREESSSLQSSFQDRRILEFERNGVRVGVG